MSPLAPTLQAFFTDRLLQQRHASPHTIAAYRDTWKLLVRFAAAHLAKAPSQLELGDLDAPLIGRFLVHLEHDRANSVRTRNARLSAIHALFRYALLDHPEQAAVIARVLAIPLHTLFALAVQTGLRASELTGLHCADLHLARGAHVNCLGKGRKPHASPHFAKHQITPKTSRYTRCSMSMLPNVSINGRIRSSGQLGRWWYSISPCRNNECVRRFTVFAFNQRS